MKSPIPVRFYHELIAPNPLQQQPPLSVIFVPDGESPYAFAYWVRNDGKPLQIRSHQARWSKAINNSILYVDGRFYLTPQNTNVRFPLMLDGEEFLLHPYFGIGWSALTGVQFVPSAGWTIEPLPANGFDLVRVIADEPAKTYRIIAESSRQISPTFDINTQFTFDGTDYSWDQTK